MTLQIMLRALDGEHAFHVILRFFGPDVHLFSTTTNCPLSRLRREQELRYAGHHIIVETFREKLGGEDGSRDVSISGPGGLTLKVRVLHYRRHVSAAFGPLQEREKTMHTNLTHVRPGLPRQAAAKQSA